MEFHQLGQIQLHNIHDPGNLVALCSICHFAFDSDEWTFIPEDTTDWVQRIEATPQTILEYNSQRNIVYRRLLLTPDPDSKAFQDAHYKSAFTHNPTKMWSGEPGAIMVRPLFPFPPKPTAELRKTLVNFKALQELWSTYTGSCSKDACPICQKKSEKEEGKEKDEDHEEEDDNEEDDRNEKDVEEHEEPSKDISSSRKSRKGKSKRRLDSAGQQSSRQPLNVKKSTQASKRRKISKSMGNIWIDSAPYDESVPYTHRYGYTWANTTSNQLMQMWQAYRKPAE